MNELQEDLKPLQPMWTVVQVAKYLNINRMTVYVWIRAGKIQTVKVGSRIRIPRSEVERLVEGEVKKLKSEL